jgi:ABC-type transporter Mla subunit MlaD
MRGAGRQLAASPVLIGAVTVLVAIVAVFISYSANQGLPFVPTYKLNAEIPNGAKLVPGNEVRAGGFRVGVVDDITAVRRTVDGREQSVARLVLKLDKKIEPLSVDTRVSVRPRSALGLKYVELIPGHSRRTFETGSTVPLWRTCCPPSRRAPAPTPSRRCSGSATRSPAAATRSTTRSASCDRSWSTSGR